MNIGCRTVHLAAFGLLLGGHVWGVPAERLLTPLWLTVASGLGLAALDLAQTAVWLVEVRGLLVLVKVGLLLAVPWAWDYRVPILVAVLVIASVGSHMPGRFRHASLAPAMARSRAPGALARLFGRNGGGSPLVLPLHDVDKGEHP